MTASKPELYRDLARELAALLARESDRIANAANMAALLYHGLPDVNWAGFYFRQGEDLVLGPFQGPIACTRIGLGKGVCGSSWKEKKVLIVPNVDEFPGHIACSSDSRSEIVLPAFNNNEVALVLDVDSDVLNDFNEIDQKYLGEVMRVVEGLL